MEPKPTPIRRVITGHDKAGSAMVIIDGDAQNTRAGSSPGQFNTLMWATDSMPCTMPVNMRRLSAPARSAAGRQRAGIRRED